MRVAGLFAGIGGFEEGLRREGHHAELLCDVLPQSKAVLEQRFEGVRYIRDIARLKTLPSNVDLVVAGFPCQDLSQAGRTAGIHGEKSSVIGYVFDLLWKRRHSRRRLPTLVLENVPFMLQLGGGHAMRTIASELERLGYRWAYRVVDTYSFGLPQRRERVFLVASTALSPESVLFADDKPIERPKTAIGKLAHGFYWTEGLSGLGWAVDAVPTLKNGSTLGIASPPAILMPDGRIVKPSIEDAEAMQGFDRGWTAPAEDVTRKGYRWGLVGSAVSVPVAQWIGQRLKEPGVPLEFPESPFPHSGKCPNAARFDGRFRYAVQISTDPLGKSAPHLESFISEPLEQLSLKAAYGFLSRTRRAKLRLNPQFIAAVERHVSLFGAALPPHPGAMFSAA